MIAQRWTFATDAAGAMAFAAPGIVGKTIAHLVVKRWQGGEPRNQLLLVFTDGTYYEFYTFDRELTGASAMDQGGLDEVRRYQGTDGIVLQASAPETMDGEPVQRRSVHGPDCRPADEVEADMLLQSLREYIRRRK